MSYVINKENSPDLINLFNSKYPVLTVSAINALAEECNTTYENMVHYIHSCRQKGLDINQCLTDIIRTCRTK
jgi:hypothetical protein